MVQAPPRKTTLGEFLQQPDTKPASEYIGGKIVQKPMPKADHSGIQLDLSKAIDASLRPNQVSRAFPELRCTFDDRSIVPDITVLPWERIPRSEYGKLSGELLSAPDWMIEILSEGQSQTKVVKRIFHALEQGTQLGWLIDPLEDCVFTYTPDLKVMLYELPEQVLPVPEFAKEFKLTVGELTAWLYE